MEGSVIENVTKQTELIRDTQKKEDVHKSGHIQDNLYFSRAFKG